MVVLSTLGARIASSAVVTIVFVLLSIAFICFNIYLLLECGC